MIFACMLALVVLIAVGLSALVETGFERALP
jgi:hypothetical protein